jgi:imidazolonepropionase-like amidohydrolase
MRGFTKVRDAAGADYGAQLAIQRGFLRGPRLFIYGAPLSQTGGHADIRPRGVEEFIFTCAGLGLFPALADGVPEVRRAVRELGRTGRAPWLERGNARQTGSGERRRDASYCHC